MRGSLLLADSPGAGDKTNPEVQPPSSQDRGISINFTLKTLKAPNGERSGYVSETFRATGIGIIPKGLKVFPYD